MSCLSHCWWQILLAAFGYFAVGAIWFNPKVMGGAWQKAHNLNFTEEQKKKGMGPVMLMSFLCTIVLSAVICYMRCHTALLCTNTAGAIVPCSSLWHSVKIGLLLGGGTAGFSIMQAYLYQMKPRGAYVTDIGYHVIGSVVASLILHFTC